MAGARLDDIERRGRDIPVREHLGIRAFGINAFTPADDGTLIGEHDEAASGQEELYIVLDGNAAFEIDGETVEAPAGTFVLVRPESRRKARGTGTVLAGETGDETFEHLRRSVELLPLFREQARNDDDLAAAREDPRFEEALRE